MRKSFASVLPTPFFKAVKQKRFGDEKQHDAHNFFPKILKWLLADSALLSNSVRVQDVSDDKDGDLRPTRPSEKEWRKYTRDKDGRIHVIHEIFYGQMRRRISCYACESDRIRYKIFADLQIDLPPADEPSDLKSCLRAHFERQRIPSKCPECSREDASMQQELSRMPQTLVILLKR